MYKSQLISVVVVTYKQCDFVWETLDSILKQDYPKIEIIITDDRSNNFPKTEIVNYIEQNKGSNIINYCIIHNTKNEGTVKNINRGIKKSNGEYLKLIAGDDVYFDEKVFRVQVDFLHLHPKAMLVTGKTCECDEQLNCIIRKQVENTNEALATIFDSQPKEYFKRYLNFNQRNIIKDVGKKIYFH